MIHYSDCSTTVIYDSHLLLASTISPFNNNATHTHKQKAPKKQDYTYYTVNHSKE